MAVGSEPRPGRPERVEKAPIFAKNSTDPTGIGVAVGKSASFADKFAQLPVWPETAAVSRTPFPAQPCRRLFARAVGVLALLLGLCGLPAHALMLGQPEGTLLLGHPLRLRIPVRRDPGLPLALGCVRVSLLDGDTPVAQHALHLSVRDPHARVALLEVRSSRVLRAPFVQLSVAMQCQFRLRRRYTLLVEPPISLPTAFAPPSGVGHGHPRHAPRRHASARHASARHARRRFEPRRHVVHEPQRHVVHRGARVIAAARAEQRVPAPHVAPHVEPHVAPRVEPQARQGSRLRMQLLSAAAGSQPAAAAAAVLAHAAAAAPPASPTSAARPASGAQPPAPAGAASAAARLAQRLQSLQARLQAQQQQGAARAREIAALRGQLDQARAQHGTPAWYDAAIGALAALSALLALLLWQRRQVPYQSPWQGVSAQAADSVYAASRASSVLPMDSPPTYPPPVPLSVPVTGTGTGPGAPNSGFDTATFRRPLSAPEQVQIDEVVDQGHVADFLIGLGDYDKAIEIMRRALADSGGGLSVLPYLYLFDLYRRTGRRAEYEQLLQDCRGRLNVRVPAWEDQPEQEPRDLLDYPRALALLSAAWGTPACLTVIERMIADDPRKPRVGFDLPAYRDLLDLYALARELQRTATPPGAAAADDGLDLELLLRAPGASAQDEAARYGGGTAGAEPTTLPPLDFHLSTQVATQQRP